MTDWIKILREIADAQEKYAPYDNFDDSEDLRGAADYFETMIRDNALSEISAMTQSLEAYAAQVEAENKLERAKHLIRQYVDPFEVAKFDEDDYEDLMNEPSE